ncbi:MAG: hypothetical protein MJ250_03745 [Alphaproteobacteria bacterium]|nr:hypothetical protein [Alphaproteobacteria bacterium]
MSCSFNVKKGKITNLKYYDGYFDCSGKRLTSLEGCPKEINGAFECNCNKLINLKGCPKKIKGAFDCSENQLTNLEGCPEKVEGYFTCSENQLTSLKGCPKEIKGNFDCSDNQLTNLEGCPEKVEGTFDCSDNPLLVDISDFPSQCQNIMIRCCPKIAKFSEKFEKTLEFLFPTQCVRQMIKEQSFYEVINEDEISITVRLKTIGEKLLDDL